MKKFKKLFAGVLAFGASFLFVGNILVTAAPKVNVYWNSNDSFGTTLEDYAHFELITPKGNPLFNIDLASKNYKSYELKRDFPHGVPYGMSKDLKHICADLLNKIKSLQGPKEIEITQEKYYELTKICQTIKSKGKRKPILESKEKAFKELILNIFEIYRLSFILDL